MNLPCPGCHTVLNIPDHLAGASIRCPSCKRVFSAPKTLAPPAPAPQEFPPLELDSPGDRVRHTLAVQQRRTRSASYSVAGFFVVGVLALMVLLAAILGPVHFQNAFFYLVVGVLASGLIVGLILFRLLRSNFFPDEVRTSVKFHASVGATVLFIGVGLGLLVYLSRIWGPHKDHIAIILGVSFFCALCGAVFGWFFADVVAAE